MNFFTKSRRRLLLFAALLCAGMASMKASTVNDLQTIRGTYVYAFDAYTQNGGVQELMELYLEMIFS